LAAAAWTLRDAFEKFHSINFPHPGRSGRQVTRSSSICFRRADMALKIKGTDSFN
jgi:hypothetical protein